MRIKMANKLPPSRVRSCHSSGYHLARINRHRGHSDAIHDDIISVPVCDMSVKAHVHDVPDGGVINAHLKRRIIGVDEAVDL
jgi:hypothetical protein